jgi:ubiquitin-protein ligase
VDVIQLRTAISKNINKLCHDAGGCSVLVTSKADIKRIVQSEAFLSIEFRGSREGPVEGLDAEFPNKAVRRAATRTRLLTPESLTRARDVKASGRDQRIMQELRRAGRSTDPGIKVFGTDRIDEWRVFLRGDDGTPYEKKWWYLNVTFPDGYPHYPPKFRFISVPYHVNISKEGRICLNVLELDYDQGSVLQMICDIRELLRAPNYESPIDTDVKALYLEGPDRFQRHARIESRKNGKDSLDEWLQELNIG